MFEIELVRQVEINIDYILMLVEQYHASNCEDKDLLALSRENVAACAEVDWGAFVAEQKEKDIATLIEEENLKPEETNRFLENAFRDGVLKTTGTDIDRILPALSRFSGGGGRAAKKQGIIRKLLAFYEKYSGLV